MAEVQDRAQADLPLVGGHDLRLELARASHGVRKRARLARKQCSQVFVEPVGKA
jgi:hypothetical protein